MLPLLPWVCVQTGAQCHDILNFSVRIVRIPVRSGFHGSRLCAGPRERHADGMGNIRSHRISLRGVPRHLYSQSINKRGLLSPNPAKKHDKAEESTALGAEREEPRQDEDEETADAEQ